MTLIFSKNIKQSNQPFKQPFKQPSNSNMQFSVVSKSNRKCASLIIQGNKTCGSCGNKR